jgi:hypothetical protein
MRIPASSRNPFLIGFDAEFFDLVIFRLETLFVRISFSCRALHGSFEGHREWCENLVEKLLWV